MSTIILQETRADLYFCRRLVWVYLRPNVCSGLRKTHPFCNRVHIDHSWSSKSMILVGLTVEKRIRYATSC